MSDDELLEKMKSEGFFAHNKYEVLEIRKDSVVLKANIVEEALNPYGILHGGFIFGLGDTAMGMMVKSCGRVGLTMDSNIQFLRVAKGRYIKAVGSIIKLGSRICTTKAELYDEEERLIAIMNANYCFMEGDK